jgi:hypothetical protein
MRTYIEFNSRIAESIEVCFEKIVINGGPGRMRLRGVIGCPVSHQAEFQELAKHLRLRARAVSRVFSEVRSVRFPFT